MAHTATSRWKGCPKINSMRSVSTFSANTPQAPTASASLSKPSDRAARARRRLVVRGKHLKSNPQKVHSGPCFCEERPSEADPEKRILTPVLEAEPVLDASWLRATFRWLQRSPVRKGASDGITHARIRSRLMLLACHAWHWRRQRAMSMTGKMDRARVLIRERRWREGLHWFLAEFLVVVVGVLVALAVSAWWQGRQDREHERQYLQQLDADLHATESDIQHAQTFLNREALAAAAVVHAFWGARPASDAELRSDLVRPWQTARFRPVLGNIQALISSGDINVIRSAALRSQLVSYAEWSKARLEDIGRYDETYYRPGVNELLTRIDPAALVAGPLRKKYAGQAHAFDLASFSASGDPPFPIDLASVLKDRTVYNAYQKIMLAHRNEANEYGLILERARYLHALVYRQLHGVAEPGNCQLQLEVGGKDLTGTCGRAFGAGLGVDGEIRLRLHPVDAITSGRWQAGETPAHVWAGKMAAAGLSDTGIELQVSTLNAGILRTQLGWFPVRALEVNDDGTRLSFRLDTAHEVAPDRLDIAILRKAKTLLSDTKDWDRHDDRQCKTNKPKLSLYCALESASISETGGFHHRRPALQIVRRLVDERSVGRRYRHRMRDYNNDQRTTLVDMQALLDQAIGEAQNQQAKDHPASD